MPTTERLVAVLDANLRPLQSKLKTAQSNIGNFSDRASRRLDGLRDSLLSFKGILLAAGAALAGRALVDFGAQMSEVQAITGATSEEFERLRSTAQNLGESTRFSAGQAAAGMAFLARAGFDASEVISAIPAALDLAVAGNLGLARSADITSNIMQAFSASAEDAGKFADILASTASKSNTNVEQLGEAMKFAGPVANSLGVSVEETAAAVGVLSNAGLQASLAGTGMRRVLTALAAPTEDLRAKMGGLTVEADGFQRVIEQLAAQSITTGEAMQLFGDRGGTAFLVLQDGTNQIRDLSAELQNAGGFAEDIARIMDNNLKGSLTQLASASEGLVIALGDAGLVSVFRFLADSMTAFIRRTTALTNSLTDALAPAVNFLGSALRSSFLKPVLDLFSPLATLRDFLTDLRGNVVLPLAEAFIRLQSSLGLITEEIKTNALAGLESLRNKTEETKNEQKKLTSTINVTADAIQVQDSSIEKLIASLEKELTLMRAAEPQRRLLATLMEAGADATEQQKSRITELVASLQQLEQQEEMNAEKARELQNFAREFGAAFESSFESAVIEGGKLGDVFNSLTQDIARMILRLTIVKPLVESIAASFGGFGGFGGATASSGGGGIGGLFSGLFSGGGSGFGFFAQGGQMQINRPSIVGENGPEMLIPRSSTSVVPNSGMGGTGTMVSVTNNVNVSTGVVETVRNEITQLLPAITNVTTEGVIRAARKGGRASQALGLTS